MSSRLQIDEPQPEAPWATPAMGTSLLCMYARVAEADVHHGLGETSSTHECRQNSSGELLQQLQAKEIPF